MLRPFFLLFLTLGLLAADDAGASPACGEEWGDLDTVDLDSSDLAQFAKTPGGEYFFGKATCVSGGEENLIAFRWKVEKTFRLAVEKNYAAHAKFGQPDEHDYICRFEGTNGLPAAISFERPAMDGALHKSYAKKECGGNKRFGFAELSLEESSVRMRCGSKEKMGEWERQCGGRELSSVKVKAHKAAPKKAHKGK